jgi:hypothetical protein
MSESQLPIIYIPTSSFTSRTNAAFPVILRAIRAGAVYMIEWESLKYVDRTPFYVDASTVVLAMLILAVLESKDWLDFKSKKYFPFSLCALIIAWFAINIYAYLALQYSAVSSTPMSSSRTQYLQLDDARRWETFEYIRTKAQKNGNYINTCTYAVSLGPNNSASDMWSDLYKILDAAKWKHVASDSSEQIAPPGISVLTASNAEDEASICADALKAGLDTLPVKATRKNSQSTPTLSLCGSKCVEVQIGSYATP